MVEKLVVELENPININTSRSDEIYVHDELLKNGKLYLGEEISEEVMNSFGKDLWWCGSAKIREVEVAICSPGGSVFNGLAIFDMIRRAMLEFGMKVTTVGEGFQASMGSILLQAGAARKITKYSFCMIHKPSSVALGDTDAIEDEAKLLKRLQGKFLDIYMERSNLMKNKIEKSWQRKDWWLDSKEMLEVGLVDEIIDTSYVNI